MTNSNLNGSAPAEQAPNVIRFDFDREREQWLRKLFAKKLKPSSKIVATALSWHFNREHWEQTGELKAFPSERALHEATGLSRVSIVYGIAQLEAGGDLAVERFAFNPKTRNRPVNRYVARCSLVA